jgi:hypothetical protein
MAQGPSLIFDKSSLESLNLDEAVMMAMLPAMCADRDG